MNIIPKLNLNKHPKDSENLSLVNALNMKLSHDESCLTSEDSVRENSFIHNYLNTYYGFGTYVIVGTIPCNNELVIIVHPNNNSEDSDIFRYQEPINNNTESMYCAYGGVNSLNRFKYKGGLIKGAFTYNVESSLVVAITEYNVSNVKIPLRTINLGNAKNLTIHNDKDLPNSKLATSPELRLPGVNNLEYLPGAAYKGWYYLFIRYKINSVDYTQWHSIGVPIYVDSLEQFQIIRYAYNRDTKLTGSNINALLFPPNPPYGYGAGASDYFSNTSEIAKETFKVDLAFTDKIEYNQYQIGIICTSKTYTKAFRTTDIYNDKNFTILGDAKIQQYVLDNKSLIEYNVIDLIDDNFNYYNVKNLFNYKNRLYVANYEEDNANDKTISKTLIDRINVNLSVSRMKDYGLVNDIAIVNGDAVAANQYDSYSPTQISLATYLNISSSVKVTVRNDSNIPNTITDKAGTFYIVSEGNGANFIYVEHRDSVTNAKTFYGRLPNRLNVIISVINRDGVEEFQSRIDTSQHAINGAMRYINPNISFDERKKQSTLIAGEVYNFFIHFVNGYSHATNGYQLTNKTVWVGDGFPSIEIIPVPFNVKLGGVVYTYYAAVPIDNNVAVLSNVTDNKYDINTVAVKFYTSYQEVAVPNPKLINPVSGFNLAEVVEAFKEHFASYANDGFLNTKWYQVSSGLDVEMFQLFINNNGDRLFKVPTLKSFEVGIDGMSNQAVDFKTYNLHTLYRMVVANVEIPAGYDGFYLSYEAYEPHARATGLLTRNDFRSQDFVPANNTVIANRNHLKSDKMFFYSGIYDIADSIKLDYNIMRIEAVNVFKSTDMPEYDYMQLNSAYNFVHDMNKPQIGPHSIGVDRTYAIPEYKLVVADSAADNRMGLGTALQLKDSYNLFPSYKPTIADHGKIKLYRVTLLNTTRDVYMSTSKKLVRLDAIYYRDKNAAINATYNRTIDQGYNGHYTYDGIIVYENPGLAFNTTKAKATRFDAGDEYYPTTVSNERPHTYQNDVPFMAYLQIPVCADVFYESKSFKNKPVGVVYVTKTVNEVNSFAKGQMVTPANSIDLFENKQGSADEFNPKTYTNYRPDLVSVELYGKTLRRSNVIQDETRANGWRKFSIEAYKNITENKGVITNIVGAGTVLLVHTEHSLFMFNTDNTLRTRDKDIELAQPDAFEVEYKEVFTSDKGFGGLQDDKSYILDEFGYIFYSNDTHRIHRFDNNELGDIDDDIIQWLSKYKPFNVRIANDKENNRLLFKFNYKVGDNLKFIVMSYSYKSKSFISIHSYYFDEGFNTKTGLYLKCDNRHNGCSYHSFIYNGGAYSSYDNILNVIGTVIVAPSKLSIIINAKYDTVKFLELISYKLVKYVNDANIDFTLSPVEGYIEPFAGNKLTVYNNLVNTGELDINVNSQAAKNGFGIFDKPYWELGMWNFNYLRDKIDQLNLGMSATSMTRIYGNYFVIEFTFNNEDGRRIDFEELKYLISET